MSRTNTLTPSKRFSIRLALAAGATVATLFGSQTLLALDNVSQKGSTTTIVQAAAPQIVVVKHSRTGTGNTVSQVVPPANIAIQPPDPVALVSSPIQPAPRTSAS